MFSKMVVNDELNLNKVLIKIKANKSGSLPLLQMLPITMVFDKVILEYNRAAETALLENSWVSGY